MRFPVLSPWQKQSKGLLHVDSIKLSSYRCIYSCDFTVKKCSINRANRDNNHRNCIARIFKTLALDHFVLASATKSQGSCADSGSGGKVLLAESW